MTSSASQSDVSVLMEAQLELSKAVSEQRFDDAVPLSQDRHRRLQEFLGQTQDEAIRRRQLSEMLASNAELQRQLEDFRRNALDSLKSLEQGARARQAYDG